MLWCPVLIGSAKTVMHINPVKMRILQVLWETGKPMKPAEIAILARLKFPSIMVHIIWLIKKGYVLSPERGYYLLTMLGKEALGFPRITKEAASIILNPRPMERVFHFHTGIGQYSGIYADSLHDFYNKIQTINIKSLEFHTYRGDFELWFEGLGDKELAKRLNVIRETSVHGEELRKKISEATRLRLEELTNL